MLESFHLMEKICAQFGKNETTTMFFLKKPSLVIQCKTQFKIETHNKISQQLNIYIHV